MRRDDVNNGDVVTIEAMGFATKGTVVYVDYFKGSGWDIEFKEASNPKVVGGYGHWKQNMDGGRLLAINGVALVHDCVDCVDARLDGYSAPCRYCSKHDHWTPAHNKAEEVQNA